MWIGSKLGVYNIPDTQRKLSKLTILQVKKV